MKKLLGILILALILVSATTSTIPKPDAMHSMVGTWELQHFYNYNEDGSISDTIPLADGYRQIKMYYNGKVMWTRYVPKDSVEWFGYGSYEITQDRLRETLEYGSASMMNAMTDLRVFEFELMLTTDTFRQVFLDSLGHRVFSENYKRLD